MKKLVNRTISILLSVAILVSLCSVPAMATEPEAPAVPDASVEEIVPVGSFELMENIAVTDSERTPEGDWSFYLYKPTEYHNFDLMSGQLNAVIYYYPDEPFANKAEAYAAIENLGLIEIAEATPAFIVIPNPLNGESYTEADLDAYYESQFYMAGGKIISFTPPTGEFERLTYHNMQYIVAEGDGATFVHNVLSQNCNRIAGILTVGGEMADGLQNDVALPAYLVDAPENAVDYYMNVNGIDEIGFENDEFIHQYNSSYYEKQVIIDKVNDTLTAEVVWSAWDNMLSSLTRAPMLNDVVANTMDMSEWVLMSWPSYDMLGLDIVEGSYNYDGKDYVVYDYVPESYTGDEAVPLVVLLHGFSEDPLCPAATCGWAEVAASEGVIVVAPDYVNDIMSTGAGVDCIMTVVNETLTKYNIDESRVYLTGFSMGGMNTMLTAFQNPDVFAAIAPMSGVPALANFDVDGSNIDMPTFFLTGLADDKNVTWDENGNVCVNAMSGNMFPIIADFNGLSWGDPDYTVNPFGYESEDSWSIVLQDIQYDFYDYYVDEYLNPIMTFAGVQNVAHACSNQYAWLAWSYISCFARGEDGSVIELNYQIPEFTDTTGHWAEIEILTAGMLGLVNGYEDGSFQPDKTVIRSEAAKIMAIACGADIGSGATGFTDVPENEWYAPYVAGAVQAGAMKGVSDTAFDPAGAVTRAQAATMMVQALGLTGTPSNAFSDVATDAWYADEVAAAAEYGIVTGYPDGTFKPEQTVTRAELVVMLLRAAMVEIPEQPEEPEVPEGASFELLENAAVTDSPYTPEGDWSFYLYKPSNYHNFDLMSGQLNAVIYVYPDTPYASEMEAYAAIEEMGLIDIAEKTPAFIAIPNPLNGESYTEEDLSVYWESQIYMAGGKIISFTPPTGEFERLTYHNMQYIIAEGDGATFVNNVLSQNCNRIAGILTFGGEMAEGLENDVALPAYLVSADETAVEYYKAVNEVDTEPTDGYFVNSSYSEKQVYVAEGGDSFDAGVIAEAWGVMLSRLTRAPMLNDVVANTMDMSEWVLMTWPNYDELGLTLEASSYNYDGKDYVVYNYIPDSYTGDEAVPLVVLLHGFSEDPLCPAATCGWADMAAENGFILVAPDYVNDIMSTGAGVDCIMTIVNQTLDTFNIDESRVYLTGFSMGGMNTMLTAFQNPGVFAAVAPMSGVPALGNFNIDGTNIDMPTFFLTGLADDKNVSWDEDGNVCVNGMSGNVFPIIADFNGLSWGDPDYTINPFGYESDNNWAETHQDIVYNFYDYNVDGYTNPLLRFVGVDNVAHACSNVYASLAWSYLSNFARGEDGSIIELNAEPEQPTPPQGGEGEQPAPPEGGEGMPEMPEGEGGGNGNGDPSSMATIVDNGDGTYAVTLGGIEMDTYEVNGVAAVGGQTINVTAPDGTIYVKCTAQGGPNMGLEHTFTV